MIVTHNFTHGNGWGAKFVPNAETKILSSEPDFYSIVDRLQSFGDTEEQAIENLKQELNHLIASLLNLNADKHEIKSGVTSTEFLHM